MHELAIAQAIVDVAERYAEGRPVTVVRVRLGRLRQVVGESLRFYFEIAAKPIASPEGAALEWERVDSRLRCGGCGTEWDPAPPPAHDQAELIVRFRCPSCESSDHSVVSGDELIVDSIDVEEPAVAASGQAGEA
ncbi:MAG: hydrogenase maturation nickel metallochaperone HypA [bacterium]